jgi:nitrite reductase (NADH) small subunit
MSEKHIGSVSDFPDGRGTGIRINNRELAIFNLNGDVYAVLDRCLHKNYTLHPCGSEGIDGGGSAKRGGVDEKACQISCPWHGLEWDLRTGHNPVLDKRIPTYNIEVRDGEVYIDL